MNKMADLTTSDFTSPQYAILHEGGFTDPEAVRQTLTDLGYKVMSAKRAERRLSGLKSEHRVDIRGPRDLEGLGKAKRYKVSDYATASVVAATQAA